MRVQVDKIKINPGRRELLPEHVEELAKSITELGLLNPITVDHEYTLIAGLHRLEAAKKLGWSEVEATVISLEGLQAELAEIDENFVRRNLSTVEYGELLLRRKEIYETLHPEVRNGGDRRSGDFRTTKCRSEISKSFVQDTAGKLGVTPRTVERQIQTAKNLTAEAKEILRHSDVSKKDTSRVSHLPPEQQKEAASLLAAGKIKSIDEYAPKSDSETVDAATAAKQVMPCEEQPAPDPASSGQSASESRIQPAKIPMRDKHNKAAGRNSGRQKKTSKAMGLMKTTPVSSDVDQDAPQNADTPPTPPYSLGSKRYATIKESVADLKDPNKDCSCTPDSFLAEIDAFVQKFIQEIEWFYIPYYDPAIPRLTQVQFNFFRQQMDLICGAASKLISHVKEGWSNHGQET